MRKTAIAKAAISLLSTEVTYMINFSIYMTLLIYSDFEKLDTIYCALISKIGVNQQSHALS